MNDLIKKHLSTGLSEMPLIAILRGIQPVEIESVAKALIDAGFRFIEVPLNSPEPWDSITRLRACCPDHVIVGAGTVLSEASVEQLASLAATMVVTPNSDPNVISAAQKSGLATFTGFVTPTEAFSAIKAGTTALKLFPAERMGIAYFKDIKAVLPVDVPVLAVGGVNEDNMALWHQAGIKGFGFGSNLYKPGRPAAEVKQIANRLVAKWRQLESKQ